MREHLERAGLLLGQSRYDAALQELAHAFAEDPDDPTAHALAALVQLGKDDVPAAREHAEEAVRADPELAFTHYVLAQTFLAGNRHKDARREAEIALHLDVEDADNYALLAAIHLAMKNHDQAVAVAEEGLLIDPQSTGCMNIRAQALAWRGDAGAATEGLADALAEDPEDSDTHANLGWALLHEGDHEQATVHFAEALRLDPENEWARDGMATALKAKNLFYRWALKWYLWVGGMSGGMQWALIIGLWLLFRFSRSVSRDHPEIAPWILPVQIVYVAFCALTWLAEPIFDMLLLFDERGRVALRPRARRGAIAVTLLMAFGLLNLALYFVAPPWADYGLYYAALALILCAPLYAAFSVERGWPTLVAAGASVVLIGMLLGIFGISAAMWVTPERTEVLSALRALLFMLTAIGAVAALWGSNFLHQAQPRR